MRAILDFRFWILDCPEREHEPGAQATGRLATALVIFALGLISACSSTPSYPPPKADSGQILVQLKGESKEGVTGPKRESVQKEYGTTRESIEKGEAFERVDYDAIEDVVVIAKGGRGTSSGSLSNPATLELTEDGFDRQQILVVLSRFVGGEDITGTIRVKNSCPFDVALFGFSGDNGFEAGVPAGTTKEVAVDVAGTYELYCDEVEEAGCRVFVTTEPLAWIGPSNRSGFFDGLKAGEYTVTIYPPRLPPITKTVTVTAGKRETVTADLTVNDLPEVGE